MPGINIMKIIPNKTVEHKAKGKTTHYLAGKVADLPKDMALDLINRGHAELVLGESNNAPASSKRGSNSQAVPQPLVDQLGSEGSDGGDGQSGAEAGNDLLDSDPQ